MQPGGHVLFRLEGAFFERSGCALNYTKLCMELLTLKDVVSPNRDKAIKVRLITRAPLQRLNPQDMLKERKGILVVCPVLRCSFGVVSSTPRAFLPDPGHALRVPPNGTRLSIQVGSWKVFLEGEQPNPLMKEYTCLTATRV